MVIYKKPIMPMQNVDHSLNSQETPWASFTDRDKPDQRQD